MANSRSKPLDDESSSSYSGVEVIIKANKQAQQEAAKKEEDEESSKFVAAFEEARRKRNVVKKVDIIRTESSPDLSSMVNRLREITPQNNVAKTGNQSPELISQEAAAKLKIMLAEAKRSLRSQYQVFAEGALDNFDKSNADPIARNCAQQIIDKIESFEAEEIITWQRQDNQLKMLREKIHYVNIIHVLNKELKRLDIDPSHPDEVEVKHLDEYSQVNAIKTAQSRFLSCFSNPPSQEMGYEEAKQILIQLQNQLNSQKKSGWFSGLSLFGLWNGNKSDPIQSLIASIEKEMSRNASPLSKNQNGFSR